MKFRIAVSALLLMTFSSAHAGWTAAVIDKILIFETGGAGMVYVYPVGGVVNPPACHGSNGDYYSFTMTRPAAKEYLALLTAAHVSGAIVEIWGLGDCADQSISETLRYFRVRRP